MKQNEYHYVVYGDYDDRWAILRPGCDLDDDENVLMWGPPEPEDVHPVRDLRPIIDELNKLYKGASGD